MVGGIDREGRAGVSTLLSALPCWRQVTDGWTERGRRDERSRVCDGRGPPGAARGGSDRGARWGVGHARVL